MADSKTSDGIGISGLFLVLFVGLKLGNVISWPWWSWNPFELSVFIIQVWGLYIFGVIGIIALVIWALEKK